MALTKVKAGNILLTTPGAGSNDVTPATTAYVTTALANLADSAPSTLDTLNELAAALGDDANFSTTVTNSIAAKSPLASPTFTGTLEIPNLTISSAQGSDGQVLTSTGSGIAWEAVPAGTTINTNADNRIITGSGTADTLNGEANLTYNGTDVSLIGGNQMTNALSWYNATTELASIENVSHTSYNDSGGLLFKTAGTSQSGMQERMRIDSSGNTIAESLYVTNDSSATLSSATKTIITQDNIEMYYQSSQRIVMGRDQYSSGHAGIVFQDPGYSTASGGVTVGSISRGTMGFATSNNSTMQNRMRINSVGGIIVGEHSTSGAIQPSGLNSGSYQGITFNSPNVSSPRHCYSWSNGLYWWNGSNEGSLAASGAWTNGSDIAFKKNVADIEYGLSTVLDLQPRKYQMKLDSADDIGFIAQEMETIIPEIVHTNVNSGYKSLDYGAITAVLVKAVQEQQALIESLTARIATLEE